MGLEFSKKTRELFVRSVLIEMKGRLASEYEDWDVEFSRLDLAEGFGYMFTVKTPGYSEWFAGQSKRKEEFYAIKNFVSDMFGYLFGGDVDTCVMTDPEKMTVEVEISSSF